MSAQALNEWLITASELFPERLSAIESWHRHIPFAFVLINMLKPRMLVELGTHKGDSYCAFCQAVTQYQLTTNCYAVDTWLGDSQAGYYEVDIFEELKQYHDAKYNHFSRLMRMSFNEAIDHFDDGSIDLLHIDGLHTYDAVKHDFENWLPKVSNRGVVLFHDTAVKEGDFGVWKLWRELNEQYRGFEFKFGFGLGVLLIGESCPQQLEAFFQLWETDPQATEQIFYRLGDGIELKKSSERLQVVSKNREVLGQSLEFARKLVEKRDHQIVDELKNRESLGRALLQARKVVEQRDVQLEGCNTQLEKLGTDLSHAREVVAARDSNLVEHLSALNQERSTSERRKDQLARMTDLLAKNRADLLHISRSRWWLFRNSLCRVLGQNHRVLAPAEKKTPSIDHHYSALELPVDIIIPVYGGLDETRACIESVLANDPGILVEIIVINDATPEVALRDWLESISEKVTLLHNEINCGFVATVNRGMGLHPDRDVLLLNSDTVVANNWLERIRDCAYREDHTASVTPLSNNATICSYPNFCEDNLLPQGYDPQSIDALVCETNAGQSVPIPTAVGFCMYIRRDSLNQVGLFDEGLFGRGYGEENEFCMRSAAMGWQHLLCEDAFVYHAGGVSFADTQNEHQQAGHKVLTRLYPDYDQRIQAFIERDPVAPGRFALDLARFFAPNKPAVLMINHGRGGGTERHLKELAAKIQSSALVLILKPHGQEGQAVKLYLAQGSEQNCLLFDPLADYSLLKETLADIGVERVHFHHTIGVHPCFWKLPEDLNVPFDYTIHDYYLACPQITMTTIDGNYCGEPASNGCEACLKTRPAPGNVSIAAWRNECSKLIDAADRVFTPSHDVERRVKRYFPGANTVYAPHEKETYDEIAVQPRMLDQDASLRVVVLGGLSNFKGADLLESCAIKARKAHLSIEFHLIGFGYRQLSNYPASNLYVHGRYDERDLEKLIRETAPHLVWFPGSCPETYSYTLSTCFRMGLPVMAHAIGSFTERLAGRECSWLLKYSPAPEKVLNQLQEIRMQFMADKRPERLGGTPVHSYFFYPDHYLEATSKNPNNQPVRKIDWPTFNLRFEKLSRRNLLTCVDETGVGAGIFGRLQRAQTMPILARLSSAMSPRLKARIKHWLTGLGRA